MVRLLFDKYGFVLCILFAGILPVTGQNLDSLARVYHQGVPDDQALSILETLAEESTENESIIQYADKLIELSERLDSVRYQIAGYLQKGNGLRLKGDMRDALDNYFKAANLAVQNNRSRDHGLVNIAIADVYSIMENHDRAIEYYREAIRILRTVDDSQNLASAYLNAGDDFFHHNELDSALKYYEISGTIFEAIDYELGVAYNLGNRGMVLAKQDNQPEAEEKIMQAVSIMEKYEDYYAISVYLTFMADIYREKGEFSKAVAFAKESLDLATRHGLKEQISDANLKLSELYESKGELNSALDYYKEFVRYRDSVINVSSIQQMANIQADYEISQKQMEVDLLNAQKKNQRLITISIGIALILIALLAVGLYRRFLFIRRMNDVIEKEKARSDELLYNILPKETAAELKSHGKVKAKRFDQVTVLFTDFKNFTPFAENLPPEKLVETVDYYFSRFDEIMEKYGIEKIKTIGDAYMAASGLPYPTDDHAYRMVRAALEIRDLVQRIKNQDNGAVAPIDIRIGINTGPIVAGVVGTKKFAYDIWGNTVNIAARVESNSEAGRINISESTYRLIQNEFICEYRGEVRLKNSDPVNMYFVKGIKNPVEV